MITRDGRTDMRDYIKDNYTTARVGVGGDSTNPNASNLDSPLTGDISATPITSGESSIDWKFTVLGSTFVGETIKEVGIFNSDDEMLLRVNYDGIGPLTSSDEIEFIITVEVD